jgi:CheY-like chemotaxis protein
MLKPNIACCYHPTTVVFVDDNKSFLDNVSLELDEDISSCSFIDPVEAVEYLQKHALISFVDKYLKPLKDDKNFEELDCNNVEHGYIDVDLFNIHKEIYNPNRFHSVAVVVVDYTMPKMNGLEICRALSDLPLKFVLLTGDATSDKAVEAFNDGLIHQFIQKNSYDFINKLQHIIYDLQKKQFVELSAVITKSLAANPASGLNDSVLIEFLEDFFRKNNIVEYYLVNESCCFLMLDSSGSLSWMVIKNEEEMTEYTNTAIDNYGKEQIIKELQCREKLLFLFTEKEHIDVSVDDWEKYLHPATKLVGKNNTYYFSHIKVKDDSDFFMNKIISYKEFLAMN